MVQCFAAAGMPPGLINCVTGEFVAGNGWWTAAHAKSRASFKAS